MTARITINDDMTGEEIPEGTGGPFTFSIQGDYYRLDLSLTQQAEFRKLVSPYIAKAKVLPSPEMPQQALPQAPVNA